MEPQTPNSPGRRRIVLDVQTIIIVLLIVVIAIMTALWQPWHGLRNTADRTIEVTGTTTVKSEPDQYVFMPSYTFKNNDKKAASEAANKKSTEVVAGLKKITVKDKDIKTSISSYDSPVPIDSTGTQTKTEFTATLTLTVTLSNREEAQKIQDYLASTEPEGQITPLATFSEAKRKQLESAARDQATKDARAKADQSAKNLGFKVGGVKQVSDGSGFGLMSGLATGSVVASADLKETAVASSPTVQPGENELSYSVSVTYYLR